MNDSRPSLLIVSFSDIENDARVRKQVDLFAPQYRVTTCGRGTGFRADVEHVVSRRTESKLRDIIRAILLRLHMHAAAFAIESEVRSARRALRGRHFDAAIANDTESIAVAGEVAGLSRTHADLHEYWPGLHDQDVAWVKVRQPYYRWMLRRYAARAGSATAVSAAIAERYTDEFGFECGVVRNASPRKALSPTETGRPIRLVHSGVAQPNRRLEATMRAVASSTADVTLDLFLTQEKSAYAEGLRELAAELGERITIHSPLPYSALVPALNAFDVGIIVVPPLNTNYELGLPNKFFDYVQARLGMVIGPTPDMVKLLEEHDLGMVTDGFDVDAIRGALDSLSPEQARRWKNHADRIADLLSAESEEAGWRDPVELLASRAGQ